MNGWLNSDNLRRQLRHYKGQQQFHICFRLRYIPGNFRARERAAAIANSNGSTDGRGADVMPAMWLRLLAVVCGCVVLCVKLHSGTLSSIL